MIGTDVEGISYVFDLAHFPKPFRYSCFILLHPG
jgi:hypothetical protein